jgi:hypothetical protein
MSVCPIGLAIVLAACGAPETQQQTLPKAPVAIVQPSSQPSATMDKAPAVVPVQDAKRNARPGKMVPGLASDRPGGRSRSRGLAVTRPCRDTRMTLRSPDS